jgi:Domain of unknown function (DUF6362)
VPSDIFSGQAAPLHFALIALILPTALRRMMELRMSTSRAVSSRVNGAAYTEEYVQERLRQAGLSLLSIAVPGTRPAGYRGYWPEIPGQICDDTQASPPSARQITEMDEALGWISLIPLAEVKLRQLVGARALTSPRTDEPIYSFRMLGDRLGVTDVTAQKWWLKGLRIITAALNRPLLCEAPRFRAGRAAVSTAFGARSRRVLESA